RGHERPRGNSESQCLGSGERRWREGQDLRDLRVDQRIEGEVMSDDMFDEADVLSNRRKESFTGDEKLTGSSGPNAREHERRDHSWKDAQLYFGKAELRRLHRYCDITRGGEPRPTAERGAMDTGNDG